MLDFPEIKAIDKDAIAKEISGKAYEIIKLKGATYFGIAGCVSMLVQCIILNQRHVRPLSTFVEEYGCVLSMPVVLGGNGVERIIEVHLSSDEKVRLQQSAKAKVKRSEFLRKPLYIYIFMYIYFFNNMRHNNSINKPQEQILNIILYYRFFRVLVGLLQFEVVV